MIVPIITYASLFWFLRACFILNWNSAKTSYVLDSSSYSSLKATSMVFEDPPATDVHTVKSSAIAIETCSWKIWNWDNKITSLPGDTAEDFVSGTTTDAKASRGQLLLPNVSSCKHNWRRFARDWQPQEETTWNIHEPSQDLRRTKQMHLALSMRLHFQQLPKQLDDQKERCARGPNAPCGRPGDAHRSSTTATTTSDKMLRSEMAVVLERKQIIDKIVTPRINNYQHDRK